MYKTLGVLEGNTSSSEEGTEKKKLCGSKDVVDLTYVLLLSVYPRLEIISFLLQVQVPTRLR